MLILSSLISLPAHTEKSHELKFSSLKRVTDLILITCTRSPVVVWFLVLFLQKTSDVSHTNFVWVHLFLKSQVLIHVQGWETWFRASQKRPLIRQVFVFITYVQSCPNAACRTEQFWFLLSTGSSVRCVFPFRSYPPRSQISSAATATTTTVMMTLPTYLTPIVRNGGSSA